MNTQVPFSSCAELNLLEDDMEDLRFPENQYFMIGNFKRAQDSKSRDAVQFCRDFHVLFVRFHH